MESYEWCHWTFKKKRVGCRGRLCRIREGRMSPDYDCPTCGLECEAVRRKRTIKTVDGSTDIEELKSYCPKCRRYFSPSS